MRGPTPGPEELALADNRVAELDLDWDPAVLRQLEQAGVALEAFWTPEEFARLLASEGPEAQPDENTVLAPPTTTTIRRGDVFQLGRHRLACGDATAATDVARLLAGATPVPDGDRSPLRGELSAGVSASGLSPAAHRRGAGHQ